LYVHVIKKALLL